MTQAIGSGEASALRTIVAARVFGGELTLIGDLGRAAAVAVVGPGRGQVELAVRQGATGCAGVGGEDADLTVLGAAGGAGVLPLHAGGGSGLIQEPGVVDDQYPVGAAEGFGDVGLQVVADAVGVPTGPRQQVLQSVRSGVAGVSGKLPAVLPGHRGESSART